MNESQTAELQRQFLKQVEKNLREEGELAQAQSKIGLDASKVVFVETNVPRNEKYTELHDFLKTRVQNLSPIEQSHYFDQLTPFVLTALNFNDSEGWSLVDKLKNRGIDQSLLDDLQAIITLIKDGALKECREWDKKSPSDYEKWQRLIQEIKSTR